MAFSPAFRHAILTASCVGGLTVNAHALVSFNDGHDKLFVKGSVSTGWNSNISANENGNSDTITSLDVGLDYERKAGVIGINSSLALDNSFYATYHDENSSDPSASLEFTKADGRLTGSWLSSVARHHRDNAAANIRAESWDYNSGLKVRYPVISRYSISGGLDFSRQTFTNGNLGLVDIDSYAVNADLLYAYTSERDIFAGVRVRHDETSGLLQGNDYATYVGVSGKILPKLTGTVRLGYQQRQEDGNTYGSWASSTALTWMPSKKLSFSGTIAKDFSTTATDGSADTLTGSLQSNYAITAKFSVFASLYAGHSRFFDRQLQSNRNDDFLGSSTGVHYSMNEHFKATLTYGLHQNWSTLAYADYTRRTFTLTLSSRF